MTGPEFHIAPATPADIPHLAAFMRAADKAEVWAAQGILPFEALTQSLALSTSAWCAISRGKPLAMWGVGAARGALSQTGSPWLLATDEFSALRRHLLRLSRTYIALMHCHFPVLENYVHANNHASIRWLTWCGFCLGSQPGPYGPFNEPFYRFWRKQCAA